MMLSWALLLWQLADCAIRTNAASVTWIFPSASSTAAYNSVDTLDAQWTSNLESPTLHLKCKTGSEKFMKESWSSPVPSTGNCSIALNVNPTAPLTCRLQLSTSNDTQPIPAYELSPDFSVANPQNVQAHTWAASVTTMLTTSAISVASPTLPAATYTSALTTSTRVPSQTEVFPSSGVGLSTGAGIGIGIGVAVGLLLLLLIATLLFLRHRRKRQTTSVPQPGSSDAPVKPRKPFLVIPVAGLHETPGSQPMRYEMEAVSVPQRVVSRPSTHTSPSQSYSEDHHESSSLSGISPIDGRPPAGFETMNCGGDSPQDWPTEKPVEQHDGPLR